MIYATSCIGRISIVAPEYHAYMKENEGKLWKTDEHQTHAEYQTVINAGRRFR